MSPLAGDDDDIIDGQKGKTHGSKLKVAEKELPGAESDDKYDDSDLDDGENSFHFFLSSPRRQVAGGKRSLIWHLRTQAHRLLYSRSSIAKQDRP